MKKSIILIVLVLIVAIAIISYLIFKPTKPNVETNQPNLIIGQNITITLKDQVNSFSCQELVGNFGATGSHYQVWNDTKDETYLILEGHFTISRDPRNASYHESTSGSYFSLSSGTEISGVIKNKSIMSNCGYPQPLPTPESADCEEYSPGTTICKVIASFDTP